MGPKKRHALPQATRLVLRRRKASPRILPKPPARNPEKIWPLIAPAKSTLDFTYGHTNGVSQQSLGSRKRTLGR